MTPRERITGWTIPVVTHYLNTHGATVKGAIVFMPINPDPLVQNMADFLYVQGYKVLHPEGMERYLGAYATSR